MANSDDRRFSMTRGSRRYAMAAIAVASFCVSPLAAQDGAPSSVNRAALCVDVESGRILYERNADTQLFPASLTKMMTLYELFSALDRDEVHITDSLTVSERASAQLPSKLGLRAGDTIPIDTAIRAITVLSANDVAVTIAENLGGTEDAFSARMTADAKTMGMVNTQFVNASGLPNPDQHASARDLYVLARRLLTAFPEYYHYFSLEALAWKGRAFSTHNHLLGKVDGVDGIKTGYIRASGFHLVASAERADHRLIAVVMGEPTARQRDEAVARLLDAEFAVLADETTSRTLASSDSH